MNTHVADQDLAAIAFAQGRTDALAGLVTFAGPIARYNWAYESGLKYGRQLARLNQRPTVSASPRSRSI